MFKEYNLNRHSQMKHGEKYENLTDVEKAQKLEALLAKLRTEQGFFTKLQKCSNQDPLCDIPQNSQKQQAILGGEVCERVLGRLYSANMP